MPPRLTLCFLLVAEALSKPIPDDLYLEYVDKTCCLNLQNQGFTGMIPSTLGLLTQFTSSFLLNENSLTGPIPSELGELTLMVSNFELSENSLTGTIPSEVTTETILKL